MTDCCRLHHNVTATGHDGRRALGVSLLQLPPELLATILSHCSYDHASQLRLVGGWPERDMSGVYAQVCRRLNMYACEYLNSGFYKVEQCHGRLMTYVKSHLPRRESERRCHSLARHNDILAGARGVFVEMH
jgi:F-box protein 28